MTAHGSGTRIDFAIIGAQKSASTAVQHYLHNHPSLYLPLGELACFESPDFEQGRVARQLDFSGAADGQLKGIKRPTIFTDIVAIDRLKDHSPDCKMIMVCREPVSRFVSHYFHLMNSAKLPVMEINRAIHAMFHGNYLSKHISGMALLRNGIYHSSLTHVREVYGPDSIFITSQKAIQQDFGTVMQRLCTFLQVPFDPDQIQEKREKNVGSYDYRRAFFRKLPNALTYNYSLGRSRKEYRPSQLLRNIGRGFSFLFGKWPFTNPVPHKDILTPESKVLLQEYYKADRENLQREFPDVLYW
ncbi:sulfotransferase domain-containing protein [Sphingorhabdus sp. SMR4y]|uniref:sulfotransferase domain-containing protein n=1 Tax=Sphingorhabdus sp. SMR4y TaxID=2584094 RepID=UPI000B5C9C7B|nr:sulfotransferase domain-containing protein [Sphingorhabdus sp. SMR4y]ASK89174.1 sulfotransferase family protein [Sphingorhabdus sp. SMR4y]